MLCDSEANKRIPKFWDRVDRLQQPFWISLIEWFMVITLVSFLAVVFPVVPAWSAGPFGMVVVGSSMWLRTRRKRPENVPFGSLNIPVRVPPCSWAVSDVPGSWVIIKSSDFHFASYHRTGVALAPNDLIVGIVIGSPDRSRIWRLI